MAIPVARVHLKVAHAALPALLPTPPKWKRLPPQLPTPCVAAILPKNIAKPGRRADSDERWDAHKAKPPPAACCPASSSASSGRRSPMVATSSSSSSRAARASSSEISQPRKNARTSSPPPLKPGRGDSAERWDAHKKAAIPASSSSSDMSSLASSSKSLISRASSAERWDVLKKRCPKQVELLGDGESSSTGSNDIDMEEEEEEVLWKPRLPRAMYAGPSFVVAAPQPSMVPMPTAFLVPVA